MGVYSNFFFEEFRDVNGISDFGFWLLLLVDELYVVVIEEFFIVCIQFKLFWGSEYYDESGIYNFLVVESLLNVKSYLKIFFQICVILYCFLVDCYCF